MNNENANTEVKDYEKQEDTGTVKYEGVVSNVKEGKDAGEHGDYAFAKVMFNGKEITVTFSCLPEVWKEKRNPRLGDVVILWGIHQRRLRNNKLGWVAEHAELKRLEKIQIPQSEVA